MVHNGSDEYEWMEERECQCCDVDWCGFGRGIQGKQREDEKEAKRSMD